MKYKTLCDYGVVPIHCGATVLCGVVLLLGWLFGLSPLVSDSSQAASLNTQAHQAEAEVTQAKEELDEVAGHLALVQQQLETQPINLQSASQINSLLAELALWSEQQSLVITRTRAGPPEVLRYYDYVPIEIAGEGKYLDVLTLIDRLHRERGDLGVLTFDLQRQTVSTGIRFEIALAWYVLSDQLEGSPSKSPQPTALVPTP